MDEKRVGERVTSEQGVWVGLLQVLISHLLRSTALARGPNSVSSVSPRQVPTFWSIGVRIPSSTDKVFRDSLLLVAEKQPLTPRYRSRLRVYRSLSKDEVRLSLSIFGMNRARIRKGPLDVGPPPGGIWGNSGTSPCSLSQKGDSKFILSQSTFTNSTWRVHRK